MQTDDIDPEGNETVWHNGKVSSSANHSLSRLWSYPLCLCLLNWWPFRFWSGGGQHDIWSLQLQHPAEPCICISAPGALLCGSASGGRAFGEEIPSCGHPGALSPHWAHTDPAGEKSKGQTMIAYWSSSNANEDFSVMYEEYYMRGKTSGLGELCFKLRANETHNFLFLWCHWCRRKRVGAQCILCDLINRDVDVLHQSVLQCWKRNWLVVITPINIHVYRPVCFSTGFLKFILFFTKWCSCIFQESTLWKDWENIQTSKARLE